MSDIFFRVTLLLASVVIFGWMLRWVSAARRFGLWMIGLVGALVVPVTMQLAPGWKVLPPPQPPWMESVEEPVQEAALVTVVDTKVKSPSVNRGGGSGELRVGSGEKAAVPVAVTRWAWPSGERVAMGLWIVGMAGLGLRLMVSAWRLRRLGKECRTFEGLDGEVEMAASEVGLKTIPRVVEGAADAVPMVWGMMRPTLLLPKGAQHWEADKRRAVLLHELAHLKRRDPLNLLVGQAARALHWFNPLVWLVLRGMRRDQERACDDVVLRQGVRASDYARYLTDFGRHSQPAGALALCAVTMARRSEVEDRVKDVLRSKASRESGSRGIRTAWWLLGAAILLPLALLQALEIGHRGRILDRNGVVLAEDDPNGQRVYPLGGDVCHVVGYANREADRIFGRAGLEKKENEKLAKGEDVETTIDAKLQSLVLRSMRDAGVERGAAVFMDPNTGEILAMVSLPTYEPSDFFPTITKEKYDSYKGNWMNPLYNRSVAPYAPGAAFLPVTGLSLTRLPAWKNNYTCTGSSEIAGRTMRCWIANENGKHGTLDLTRGMEHSCNCYWYHAGVVAGPEALSETAGWMGLGKKFGESEDEYPGIIPGPEWLAREHAKSPLDAVWTDGHTANTAIGSGMTLTTPLQMAVVASTLANSGKVFQPSLGLRKGAPRWSEDLVANGCDADGIAAIRKGLWRVVHGEKGSARALKDCVVEVAGRTGVAQFWRTVKGEKVKDNHCWFIGFAPYDKPTVAFAMMMQGGRSGGGDVAPIVKTVLDRWFGGQ